MPYKNGILVVKYLGNGFFHFNGTIDEKIVRRIQASNMLDNLITGNVYIIDAHFGSAYNFILPIKIRSIKGVKHAIN
ncbi:MAG: hypothetical protein U9O94_08645 [Nanoarchaeota archaeon]|nr:hypothetical protein [Nanoarchaeota archaeon]